MGEAILIWLIKFNYANENLVCKAWETIMFAYIYMAFQGHTFGTITAYKVRHREMFSKYSKIFYF